MAKKLKRSTTNTASSMVLVVDLFIAVNLQKNNRKREKANARSLLRFIFRCGILIVLKQFSS